MFDQIDSFDRVYPTCIEGLICAHARGESRTDVRRLGGRLGAHVGEGRLLLHALREAGRCTGCRVRRGPVVLAESVARSVDFRPIEVETIVAPSSGIRAAAASSASALVAFWLDDRQPGAGGVRRFLAESGRRWDERRCVLAGTDLVKSVPRLISVYDEHRWHHRGVQQERARGHQPPVSTGGLRSGPAPVCRDLGRDERADRDARDQGRADCANSRDRSWIMFEAGQEVRTEISANSAYGSR